MPTQTANPAQTGAGAVISIGGVTGGTSTFVPIGEIISAKQQGMKRAVTPTTNLTSGQVARKLGTVLDNGTITITVTRVSSDAGQAAVQAALLAGSAYDFKIVLPIAPGQTTTGDTITFSAIVTEAGNFDIDISKAVESTITLDIDGAMTTVLGS